MWDWSSEFRAFTPQHMVVVLTCAAVIALFCVTGAWLLRTDRRSAATGLDTSYREQRFRTLVAYAILVSQAFIFLRRFTPDHWDLGDSLPLHFCRFSVWIAPIVLLTLHRRARALSLYWGIGLSAQVFATPYLSEGHGSIAFWIYWINHLQIVGVAIYDVFVLGYRPSWKDFRFASIAGIIAAAFVAILNVVLRTNYSYLGSGVHEGASVVDKLGPYPLRMLWMAFGAIVIFVMITLVSKIMGLVRVRIFKKDPPRLVEPHRSKPLPRAAS